MWAFRNHANIVLSIEHFCFKWVTPHTRSNSSGHNLRRSTCRPRTASRRSPHQNCCLVPISPSWCSPAPSTCRAIRTDPRGFCRGRRSSRLQCQTGRTWWTVGWSEPWCERRISCLRYRQWPNRHHSRGNGIAVWKWMRYDTAFEKDALILIAVWLKAQWRK